MEKNPAQTDHWLTSYVHKKCQKGQFKKKTLLGSFFGYSIELGFSRLFIKYIFSLLTVFPDVLDEFEFLP